MSDQDDFLSRWSRRKRAVAQADAEPTKPISPEASQPEAAAPAEPSPGREEKIVSPGEPVFDPASLPPIESITAETDIRAFLASGVPADLKREALRRAWSADPAIRDFIGLSENSGDFNTPGEMAGFGPLQMTEDLRRMVAALFTPAPEQHVSDTAVHHAQQISEPLARPVPEGTKVVAITQDEVVANKVEDSTRGELSQGEANIIAAQKKMTGQREPPSTTRPTGRRFHGGALPK